MNFLYDDSVVTDARRQIHSVGKTVFPETNPLNVSKALSLHPPGLLRGKVTPALPALDLKSSKPVTGEQDDIELVLNKSPNCMEEIPRYNFVPNSSKVANIPIKKEALLMPGEELSF